MELQQIGLQHPAANLVRDIQHNRTGIPRRTFVAEGLFENNIVLESGVAVDTFLWCPEAAYSDESRTRAEQLADRAKRAYRVSGKTLARLAERPNPDGLVTIARLPDWDPAEFTFGTDALVLVTDALEIPGNLGTLLRTMDACAADCLVMTNRRTRMTHPKVLRSSQGMSIKVPSLDFDEVDDAIGWLRRNEFRVFLADTDDSVNYRKPDYRGRTALVVGSERFGISRPWYDAGFARVGIPMLGSADSLNVSVSASVLLYEARARKNGW
ncbi:TrmH family RNA methyltransferase [Amycolatopsis panacis]|uniref:RNA methyltransferase n=1 Tax=Amycolatopsis panacis TaxID=2340917 RepID=A0A419HX67_9PSEU|nr:TrmH family RNA methyltransferase [Amycolatopsis panacis]RJQ81637.1 RNA methyltransferase [Amycolatopsis panacis]